MTDLDRMTTNVVSISEPVFYDQVATELGKEKLTEHEANSAYSVRLNAIFNFEMSGEGPSPYPDNKLIDAAWRIAQRRIAAPLHIITNPSV